MDDELMAQRYDARQGLFLRALEAAAAAETAPDPSTGAAETTPAVAGGVPTPADGANPAGEASGTPTPAPAAASTQASGDLDFILTEDETLLQRTLAGTSWTRVATMLAILALATAAFFAKSTPLRWISLTVTLVVLGFMDGGFLSVSHITSGIWAGPGVYVRDLPLLLIVTFTLVTTLVWGRVFCGFLCPFGALQDVIDAIRNESASCPTASSVHSPRSGTTGPSG